MHAGTVELSVRRSLCRIQIPIQRLLRESNRAHSSVDSLDKSMQLALFSLQKILQNFSDFPSHRIFRHMHKVLNIDKNNKK